MQDAGQWTKIWDSYNAWVPEVFFSVSWEGKETSGNGGSESDPRT